MVSLSENSRHAGGFYFADDQPLIQARDVERSLEQDEMLLSASQDPDYRIIHTTPLILLQMLLFVGMTTVSFLLPFLFLSQVQHLDAFALVVLTHCGLWVVLLLVDRILYRMHTASRLNGYLSFYRRTRLLRPWAIFVSSAGSVALLVMVVLLQRLCPQSPDQCALSFRRDYFPLVVCSVELVAVIPVLVLYLVRTVQFNRQRALPDVMHWDLLSSFQSPPSHDVGLQAESWEGRLVERQADMIAHLQQRTLVLGQQLLTLGSEVDRGRPPSLQL